MIVFDLQCDDGHRFEGWFGSSADYERQQAAALVACPQCHSTVVGKAVMAPAVGRKGNQLPTFAPSSLPSAPVVHPPVPMGGAKASPVAGPATGSRPGPSLPPQAIRMMHALATMQAKALESSRWVGERFAEDARAMHYGERETETIHGRATAEEAEQLVDEGIVVMPLLIPVVPPEQAN